MKNLFKTEKEAIRWVDMNIPIMITPKRVCKYKFTYPFSSIHAHKEIVNQLGKQLFKYQQKQNKQIKNK